jgi:ribosomal protein S18 acetylase RimI-like enzyme
MHIRKALASDIEAIKAIADMNKQELGFVTKPAFLFGIQKGWLLVAEDNDVIGFLHYRHRRGVQTTVYEICVTQDYRGQGIGRMLITALLQECQERGKAYIKLKAIAGLPANGFYQHLGFIFVGSVPGNKRKLNVWRRDVGPHLLCSR